MCVILNACCKFVTTFSDSTAPCYQLELLLLPAAAAAAQVPELQNFVTSMLTFDPEKRPSAAELLQHSFLQQQQQQQ
jgi:serine/threonine protein kinase